MHSKFFLFMIYSIYLGTFSCAVPICSKDPFNCGNISYIAYPFWGGSRTSECGRNGFQLICINDVPILTMSSVSYRVDKLDFSTNTLTVARLDFLDNGICLNSTHASNSTMDWKIFKYPPDSTVRNLTLYFDCSGNQPLLATLPNNFGCGDETINLFKIGNAPAPGTGITCKNNIFVPVTNNDAESLNHPTTTSINILRSALTAGFSIQWSNDSNQQILPYCNPNAYRSCRLQFYTDRLCNYKTRCRREGVASAPEKHQGTAPVIEVPVPSPAPVHIQDAAPVPTPAGNGLPTTAHPLQNDNTTTQINHGRNHAKEIVLVVPHTVAGIITVSISVHCFLKRRYLVNGPNTQCKHDVEKFLLQHGSLTPKRYRYSEIKKITKSFSDKLGQGGYGRVYKGTLPNGCHVAVKVLIETNSNGEDFMNEVASISRTSHVNIVTLLGFCYEGNRSALVYELMPNNSLDKFLNNHQSAGVMDLEKLYKIAVGIAKGLEYLHTGCTTRIVHFDIKPQNILLDEDFCPKISDFGLAKLYKKKQSMLSVLGTRGTAGYIAPEVFSRNFGGVSHKSDVYSYGMMLLEMAGARKVAEAEAEAIQSSENYFPDKIYEEVISDVGKEVDNLMTEGEEETRKKMFVVGFWCIQTIPSNRPSITKVVEMLEGSVESIQIPPKPFLFSPNLPRHEISSSLSACVEAENSGQD